MSSRGTMVVARAVFDHPVLQGDPYDRRSAWLWLVSEGAWENRSVTVNRVAVDLRRGELAASSRYLASRWQWDHSKVRRFLDRLARDGMIERRVQCGDDGGISVLRIVNFDRWQSAANRHTSDTPPDTSTDTPHANASGSVCLSLGAEEQSYDTPSDTGGERHPTQKHIQHKKKIYPLREGWPSDAFERWYALYPKKKQPHDARRAFAKVQASGDVTFAELMARTEAARREWAGWAKDRRTFIPYPASWLNSGEYLSEPESAGDFSRSHIAEPETCDPRTFTHAEWLGCLDLYRRSGTWAVQFWGPPPGDDGCLVPAALLANCARIAGDGR